MSELETIKCLNISQFGLFLILVQLFPEAINASHIQYLVCINFPGVATMPAKTKPSQCYNL